MPTLKHCMGYLMGTLIILGVILLVSSMVGCDSREEMRRKSRLKTTSACKNVVKGLRFVKHKKSGLCFAVIRRYREGYLAQVPCDKVKELLQ